jgi:hypothetical protein
MSLRPNSARAQIGARRGHEPRRDDLRESPRLDYQGLVQPGPPLGQVHGYGRGQESNSPTENPLKTRCCARCACATLSSFGDHGQMNISEVLAAINRMQADGVIDRYAIGGAVGATFYIEPVATMDVDIFVTFRPEPGRVLVSPQPVFDYLIARGCALEGEYVVIPGWPVRFLPSTGPLVEEALAQAVTVEESKRAQRQRLAALPVAEKLRMLDALRERALTIRRAMPLPARQGGLRREGPPACPTKPVR